MLYTNFRLSEVFHGVLQILECRKHDQTLALVSIAIEFVPAT